MNNLINELISILDQENRVYEGILKISKNKTNVIIEGKVNELENIVKLEQSLVLQIGRLEDIREQTTEKLASSFGVKPSELTISALLKYAKGEQVQQLKDYQNKISDNINQLKNANEVNSKLIQNSLDYINFSLNLITTADVANNNYSNDGQVSGSKKRSLFDVKL